MAAGLEVSLNLPDLPIGGRMEGGGGMLARRVRIGTEAELDEELIGWLRAAYDRS